MTSIFEGQVLKTRPKFQPKHGSFGFQVIVYINIDIAYGYLIHLNKEH